MHIRLNTILLILLIPTLVRGEQIDDPVVIGSITIEGNRRTKDKVILRELSFASGDTISAKTLGSILETSRKQVFNLGLFNEVTLDTIQHGSRIDVTIGVSERWYILPVPIFSLADRNFNVWWTEQNRDLARTEYGIKLYWENFRGMNERLKFLLQLGYTQEFELNYKIPFIDKQQRYGARFSVAYSRNKQLAFETMNNRQSFLKTEEFIRKNFTSSVIFSYRKAIHNSHYVEVKYHNQSIGDTVAELNENYFLDGNTSQEFIQVQYNFVRDFRDIKFYPREGSFSEVVIYQSGIRIFNDINMTEIIASHAQFIPLSKRLFLAGKIKAKYSFPEKQPYLNQTGLGYSQDFVRGFELSVIDGQSYAYTKSILKYLLFDIKIKKLPLIPIKQFDNLAIASYFKIYWDMGYVYDDFYFTNNPLNNNFLSGWGLGIDLASFYDVVFRVEYSFNNFAQKGLYLHFSLDI